MRKILTPALHIAWAVIFGLLGIAAIPGSGTLLSAFLDVGQVDLGLSAGGREVGEMAAYVVALCALSSCVLFFWASAVSLSDQDYETDGGDHVSRIAYAAGVATLTLCLLAGALALVDGAFGVAMIALAALASSYIATFLERVSMLMASEPGADDVRAAARLMALGAAHNSMLSRISGRETPSGEGTGR